MNFASNWKQSTLRAWKPRKAGIVTYSEVAIAYHQTALSNSNDGASCGSRPTISQCTHPGNWLWSGNCNDDLRRILSTLSPYIKLEQQQRNELLIQLKETLNQNCGERIQTSYLSAFHLAQKI